MDIRTLEPDDKPLLEHFLRSRIDESLFLLSNLRAGGLLDHGDRFHGTYVAAIEDGRIQGVVGHFWNENLLLQAPRYLPALVGAAARRSDRPVGGLIGPWEQVEVARRALGLEEARYALVSREILYALDLDELRVPEQIDDGELIAGAARSGELDVLASWRHDYGVEAVGELPGDELLARSRETIERLVEAGELWVLRRGEEPVSMTAFNARLPEIVQVGGVWTPPELRGRGYARCVIAAHLRVARRSGADRAILFTDEENLPAQRAYEALGFSEIGTYGLAFLEESISIE